MGRGGHHLHAAQGARQGEPQPRAHRPGHRSAIARGLWPMPAKSRHARQTLSHHGATLEANGAGYGDDEAGVKLIVAAVDSADARPIWFCNWGTDKGSAESSLKGALDRVLKERGQVGYAKFKDRLRLSSADKFGEHTERSPPWRIWVDTFRPELD